MGLDGLVSLMHVSSTYLLNLHINHTCLLAMMIQCKICVILRVWEHLCNVLDFFFFFGLGRPSAELSINPKTVFTHDNWEQMPIAVI